MALPSRINILKQVPELNTLFKERGFPEGKIITQWPYIIGQELALSVTPERVTYQTQENCLHVQVHNADAIAVQHLIPTLKERINGFFGYEFIHKIHITQIPKTTPSKIITIRPRPQPQLTENEKETLEESLSTIRHPKLKKILARLGAYIFEDLRKSKTVSTTSGQKGWRSLAQKTWTTSGTSFNRPNR